MLLCKTCLMDDSAKDFSLIGEQCNFCFEYQRKVDSQLCVNSAFLAGKIREIKANNKKYDCVIGVSGGVDSSYVALLAKDMGLRALLVHFDNGWNSDIANRNIKNISKYTGFELYTYVMNWKVFKEMQKAMFSASVVDVEAITDHAIKAVVLKKASEYGVKYSLHGGNVRTEAIMPKEWRYTKSDAVNIKAIMKEFNVDTKGYPFCGILKMFYYSRFRKIRSFKILNHVVFEKQNVINRLENELSWTNYDGKHSESIFTKFYQNYFLPRKFNIDKRKCHLSNLVLSGNLSRSKAIDELQKDFYDEGQLKIDKKYVLKKLGLTIEAFELILNEGVVSHYDYKNDSRLRRLMQLINRRVS